MILTHSSANSGRDLSVSRSLPLSVTVEASDVESETGNVRKRRERMVIDAGLAAKLGLGHRSHVQLTIGDFSGVFSVWAVKNYSDELTVAISDQEAADKLQGPTLPATGTLSAFAPSTGVTDQQAQDNALYYETLADNGTQSDFLCLAPHGGQIELETEDIAQRFYDQMTGVHGVNCSLWRGIGYGPDNDQTGYERWHITSVDINPAFFPELDKLASRDFSHAISFHGVGTSDTVQVGGQAPDPGLLRDIINAITAVVDPSISVEVAADNTINGDDPQNIINRLSTSGSTIQLEMSLSARQNHGAAIADACANVFKDLTP